MTKDVLKLEKYGLLVDIIFLGFVILIKNSISKTRDGIKLLQHRIHVTSIAQIAQSRGVARGPLASPPFAPGRAAAVGAPRRAGAPRRRRGPRRVRRGGVHVNSAARGAALGLILWALSEALLCVCCSAACPVFAAALPADSKGLYEQLFGYFAAAGADRGACAI